MPVYDYRCTSCNSTYDIFHKGKELTNDIVCPKCGSNCLPISEKTNFSSKSVVMARVKSSSRISEMSLIRDSDEFSFFWYYDYRSFI